jgi:hypothetical protein
MIVYQYTDVMIDLFFHCSYSKQKLLTSHKRVFHEGAYDHICEFCAKVFKQKTYYERHKLSEHSDIKCPKVQCQICGNW